VSFDNDTVEIAQLICPLFPIPYGHIAFTDPI